MIGAMTGAHLIIVLGPSGNGKTTLATRLADDLRIAFRDADDLHPQANVERMRAGVPLTDADRAPWLAAVHDELVRHTDSGLVLACSALKRQYRDTLRAGLAQLVMVAPEVSREVLTERVAGRAGHFMPADLVDSQLATFEPLQPDEPGLTLNGEATPDALVAAVRNWLDPQI